jgi:hypothetical protein
MKQELLKDVLIEVGGIERYFGNQVPVNLWRAKRSIHQFKSFFL